MDEFLSRLVVQLAPFCTCLGALVVGFFFAFGLVCGAAVTGTWK